MTIGMWLAEAANELKTLGIGSAELDAELILSHTLRHNRTYLHAHSDEELEERVYQIADARLDLRKDFVPIAYIVGHKEFYGHRFAVTPAVLVPRPETEELITMLKKLLPKTAALPGVTSKRLVDIGTGSGVVGITAGLEFPELDVALLDSNKHALAVAKKNAQTLGADVATFESDLLSAYPYSPDIVLANLPYVGVDWERSPELIHEPSDALYAENDGLQIIERCLEECKIRCKIGAILIFEADMRQLDAVAKFATKLGFKEVARDTFAIGFRV